MGKKDKAEKILEAYNDVFADIVNVLLFNGEQVIKPDELVDGVPRSAYKAEGNIREIERDVVKRWKKQNICIACFGTENQTNVDASMPLRVMGYDGAEYRHELNDKNLKEYYPVVTLVLYFGHKKHWDKPLNLLGCLKVPDKFKPYVNDYKINLFEIAFLSDEQVELFKSDFKIVADYFVQMRKNGDYKPSPVEMEHVQEVLQLLSIMTNDTRFEEAYEDADKGDKNMSTVLDRIENRGKERGLREGAIRATIETYRDFGRSESETVSVLIKKFGLSEEESEEIASKYWKE